MAMRRLFVLVCWVLLSSCARDAGTADAPAYHLAPVGPMLIGDAATLRFDGKRTPSSRERFTWSSSDPSVLTVSAEGRVVAVSKGEAVVTADDGLGSGRLRISVADAGIGWATPLPLKARTWVAVSDDGWSFVRTVADADCGLHCTGDLLLVDPDGHLARSASGIGEMMVRGDELFFEAGEAVWAAHFASGRYRRVSGERHLLGLFKNGDLLTASDNRITRISGEGDRVGVWTFRDTVGRAVILSDDSFIVNAGRDIVGVYAGRQETMRMNRPLLPWGATEKGALLFSDPYEYGFWSYDSHGRSTLLATRFSVLVDTNDELVESHGLSASLAVPVSLQADGSSLFLDLHTEGQMGERHFMEVVLRGREGVRWRWGPSQCTDHPWAVAMGKGFAVLTDCNRIVRVSDPTLEPAGSWPQPGGDAQRSWRVQK